MTIERRSRPRATRGRGPGPSRRCSSCHSPCKFLRPWLVGAFSGSPGRAGKPSTPKRRPERLMRGRGGSHPRAWTPRSHGRSKPVPARGPCAAGCVANSLMHLGLILPSPDSGGSGRRVGKPSSARDPQVAGKTHISAQASGPWHAPSTPSVREKGLMRAGGRRTAPYAPKQAFPRPSSAAAAGRQWCESSRRCAPTWRKGLRFGLWLWRGSRCGRPTRARSWRPQPPSPSARGRNLPSPAPGSATARGRPIAGAPALQSAKPLWRRRARRPRRPTGPRSWRTSAAGKSASFPAPRAERRLRRRSWTPSSTTRTTCRRPTFPLRRRPWRTGAAKALGACALRAPSCSRARSGRTI